MSLQEYYNVLPTMKSPAPSPTSSEDSGVPIDEQPLGLSQNAPRRPPRARDEPATHEYHNLPPFGHDYQNDNEIFAGFRRRAITPPPPRLPKRQPTMARPKTPPPPRRPQLNPSFQHLQHLQFTATGRGSSVSSCASAATTTATIPLQHQQPQQQQQQQHCQPFRKRFQVRKRRTTGPCKCKTPSGKFFILNFFLLISFCSFNLMGSVNEYKKTGFQQFQDCVNVKTSRVK